MLVKESVLDYVKFGREAGASANAVIRNLTTYRNRVIVAPCGNYGSISDVVASEVEIVSTSASYPDPVVFIVEYRIP